MQKIVIHLFSVTCMFIRFKNVGVQEFLWGIHVNISESKVVCRGILYIIVRFFTLSFQPKLGYITQDISFGPIIYAPWASYNAV